MPTFEAWLKECGLLATLEPLNILPAFDVMACRIASAREAGAQDPLKVVSTSEAGPHSRRATKRMLEQLGYQPAQRRVVHRLFSGSSSGWPGLLRLYVEQRPPSARELRYVRRQARVFRAVAGQAANREH